jgi:hypothetical protein
MSEDKRKLCRISGAGLALLLISLTVFVYVEFAGLKQCLLSALSARATAAVGQRVGITDISFRLPARITVRGITIGNPDGFAAGRLLRINRIALDMRPGELLSHTFYFNKIEADSPEVTILRDTRGELNISDRLRTFLSGGSGAGYHIDILTISSGVFSVNSDDRTSAKRIDLTLRNLSSGSNAKTTIGGGLMYAGNRIKFEGWAYLKEEPGRFSVSVSTKDFSPSLFSEDLTRYKIDTKGTRLDICAVVNGDTKQGIDIRSAVRVKGARAAYLPSGSGNIALTSDSFLDIGRDTLVIRELSLHAGKFSEARLKGVITDLKKRNPAYTAELKIDRFDLGAVDFLAGVKLAGILTSGGLRAKGAVGEGIPEVSGTIFLNNASVRSDIVTAGEIDAKATMSSRRKFSFRAESAADIRVFGGHRLEKPARLRLSLHGQGRPNRMTISSSAVLTPVEITVRAKTFHAGAVSLGSDGVLKNGRFSGYGRAEIRDTAFGERRMGDFVIHSHADLGKGIVELKELSIKNAGVTAKAKTVEVKTSEGKADYRIDIDDLSADYPAESAGISHLKLSLNLKNSKESLSGSFGLSAGQITYEHVSGGPLEGGGRFDDNTFYTDLSRMRIFGGSVKCVLKGAAVKGYFPLLINMSAEKIDLADMSKALSRFVKTPYEVSGGTGSASFDGTLDSRENLIGNASFGLASFSASRRDGKRSLLKGGNLAGKIAFAGKDLDFIVDAGVGKVEAHAHGHVKGFMGKEMEGSISANVPVVKAADIRDSFWDIFPDSFLYAGLDGSLSALISAELTGGSLSLDGGVELRNFVLTGENGEYSIGPVDGTLPLTYRQAGNSPEGALPKFDKPEFAGLRRYYKSWKATDGFGSITVGTLSYGFKLLDDIKVMVKPEDGFLNIGKVSANIFGGTLEGSAVIGFSGGLKYRAGFIVDGLSLRSLCDNIGPIKGYISGKVDGVADLKSSGNDAAGLIGKADFWSYPTKDEKTMISKEFLRKVGGPAVRTYLGDRRFDKGIMDLYIENGLMIFKDLEISHRNFLGIRDLSIKVAPFNNRIRIADLLWSITEAAQRAGKE